MAKRRHSEQGVPSQAGHSCCTAVDHHARDLVPQLFGRAHYPVIEGAARLPCQVPDLYHRITR